MPPLTNKIIAAAFVTLACALVLNGAGPAGAAGGNAEAASSISFSSDSYSVGEAAGAAAITLKRTGTTDTRVSVRLNLTDVTTSPADYLSTSAADPSFHPASVAFNRVTAAAVQADGKIILDGVVHTGPGVNVVRIMRLNPDGSLDPTFNPYDNGVGPKTPGKIVLQPDGKIIFAGNWGGVNDDVRCNLVRLNPDGSLDQTFNTNSCQDSLGEFDFILQPGGKIVLAGSFTSFAGRQTNGIVRLNPDGSVDLSLNPAFGISTDAGKRITTLDLQPNGKIIIAGNFTNYNGTNVPRIARLNSDGSLDSSFNPGAGPNNIVQKIIVQPDGKVLVAGVFTNYNGTGRDYLVRLNPDGSLDTSFNVGPFPASGPVPGGGGGGIFLQPDGRIFAFAYLYTDSVRDNFRDSLVRLNPDGSFDPTFHSNVGASGVLALQPDGKLILAGPVVTITNGRTDYVARVTAFYAATWEVGDATDKTISLPITDDSNVEPSETLTLTLTPFAGDAAVGTPSSATLTIQDNEAGSPSAGGGFEFSQNVYTAAERDGSVTITVNRVGDASQAAGVNYATVEGNVSSAIVSSCFFATGLASERCDYERAAGTLRFAAGETQKTFVVFLTDDAYAEGAETTYLRLSNSAGAAVGQQSILQILDDTQQVANPIDDAQFFVRQHYRDFFNREADAEGLAFWTGQMTNCGSPDPQVCRVNVSAAFFLSIEFQQTGYLVERIYKAAYGDAAGNVVTSGGGSRQIPVPVVRLQEFVFDVKQIGGGVIVGQGPWQQQLDANKTAFALEFVGRSRFTSAFPLSMTAEEFVTRLDQNAGGVLSAAEKTQLVATLGATPGDAAKRAQVVRALAENATFEQRERNRAFVLMQYFGYLRRNPNDAPEEARDYAGYEFWLTKLEQFSGNFVQAEMVKAFITSTEYRRRFGL